MSSYQPDDLTRERYIQGKLNETEQADYELWLADHPEAVADLELDLLMQQGVRSVNEKKMSHEHGRYGLTSFLKVGVPAFVLVMVFTAWLVLNPGHEIYSVELLKTRSTITTEVNVIKPEGAWLELVVYPDQVNHPYQLIITGMNSKKMVTVDSLEIKEPYQPVKTSLNPADIDDTMWEVQLLDDTGYIEQIFLVEVKSEETRRN